MVFNSLNVSYPKVQKILHTFITQEQNFVQLSSYFSKSQNIYQYLYWTLSASYFLDKDKHSFNIRATFLCYYKEWFDRKRKPIELGKSKDGYKSSKVLVYEFEQKPIKVFLIFCMKNIKKSKSQKVKEHKVEQYISKMIKKRKNPWPSETEKAKNKN